MAEILSATSPYGLIKETETLIKTVSQVNDTLLTERRTQALAKIDDQIAAVTADVDAAGADESSKSACLKPLESLRTQVQGHESLAHVSQAEPEAVRLRDAASTRIEEAAVSKPPAPGESTASPAQGQTPTE